jgi:hypothetical protein
MGLGGGLASAFGASAGGGNGSTSASAGSFCGFGAPPPPLPPSQAGALGALWGAPAPSRGTSRLAGYGVEAGGAQPPTLQPTPAAPGAVDASILLRGLSLSQPVYSSPASSRYF